MIRLSNRRNKKLTDTSLTRIIHPVSFGISVFIKNNNPLCDKTNKVYGDMQSIMAPVIACSQTLQLSAYINSKATLNAEALIGQTGIISYRQYHRSLQAIKKYNHA